MTKFEDILMQHAPVPSDPELERIVLDALFTWDTDERDSLASTLRSKHFHSPFHQQIFEAGLKTGFNLVKAVDLCIENNESFDAIYNDRIADIIGTTKAGILPKSTWKSWSDKLIQTWRERRAHEICYKHLVSPRGFNMAEFVDSFSEIEETYDKPDLGPAPVMDEIIHNATVGAEDNERICTGYRMLDDLLQGMERKDLVVIAAPANTGKSRFAENIALKRAKILGDNQMIISYEMTKKMMVKDLISMTTGIPLRILKYGKTDPEYNTMLTKLGLNSETYVKKIMSSGDWIADKFAIVDPTEAPRSPFALKSLIKSYAAELRKNGKALDAIYVDYLQKICGDDKDKIDEWMLFLTDLPFQLRNEIGYYVPVFLVSATNRDSTRRTSSDDLFVRPSQSDLRGSGNIEFWADKIIFICHYLVGGDAVADRRIIWVEKNKSGDCKVWREFVYKGDFVTFKERPDG